MINILAEKYTYATLPEYLDLIEKVAAYHISENGPDTLEKHDIDQQLTIIMSYAKYEMCQVELLDMLGQQYFDDDFKSKLIDSALSFVHGDENEKLYTFATDLIDMFASYIGPKFNCEVSEMIEEMHEWIGGRADPFKEIE